MGCRPRIIGELHFSKGLIVNLTTTDRYDQLRNRWDLVRLGVEARLRELTAHICRGRQTVCVKRSSILCLHLARDFDRCSSFSQLKPVAGTPFWPIRWPPP